MNFVHQGFRKSDIHAYRQTDRQTDATEIIYEQTKTKLLDIFFSKIRPNAQLLATATCEIIIITTTDDFRLSCPMSQR